MNCRTWDTLFEQYEKAAFDRMQQAKNRFLQRSFAELEAMNAEITKALRDLREHELQHGCH